MKAKSYRHIIVSFAVIMGIILITTCGKKNDVVPDTYVDIYLNINSTQYIGLNSVGGWVYITGGVSGIIVYRLSIDEFVAMDRTCTLRTDSCQRVEVESSGIIAVDSSCLSRFILTDGSPMNDSTTHATIPLKQYNTTFDGEILHIFN